MTTTANHCAAKTKKGQACRAFALTGSKFCFRHDPAKRKERRAASARGGHARHGRKILFSVGEPMEVKSVADVLKVLEAEINCVLSLEVSLSRGQTIARLAGAFVSAFNVSELELRMAAIEAEMKRENDAKNPIM